jgi:hypothetical protein
MAVHPWRPVVIYYVALPFFPTQGGAGARRRRRVPNGNAAIRRAEAMAANAADAGAIAFSRSGDPSGDFEDAVILKTFDQVPDDFASQSRVPAPAASTDHQQQCSVAAGRSISLKRDSSRARGAPTRRDKERDLVRRKCRSERTPQRCCVACSHSISAHWPCSRHRAMTGKRAAPPVFRTADSSISRPL